MLLYYILSLVLNAVLRVFYKWNKLIKLNISLVNSEKNMFQAQKNKNVIRKKKKKWHLVDFSATNVQYFTIILRCMIEFLGLI